MTSPSRPGRVQVQVTRDLGLFDVTMAGLGAMLGAGIFVLAGSAARVAESSAWIALALSAFVALASALAYAELASNRPRAGGGYAWVSEAFSGTSGFLSGWTTWAGHIAAAALSALGVGVFVDYALDTANLPSLPRDVMIFGVPYNLSEKVIGAVVFLGFLGARALAPTASLGRGQVSLAKAILLAAFVVFAAVVVLGAPDLPQRLLGEPIRFPPIALAAGVVFIVFQGFEVVAQRAEHVKNPERNVPYGIFLALGLAALVYVAFEMVLLGNVAISPECGGTAWSCLAQGPRAPVLIEPELGSLFAAASISAIAAAFLFAGAIVAMASALVSNMDSGTRTAVGMARDGVLPVSMAHVTERRVPIRGLVATGAVALVLLFALNVEQLAIVAAILFLVQYAFVDVALIVLRRRSASARGFRAPFVPLVAVMAAMLSVAVAISMWSVPAFQPGELLPPGRVAWAFVGVWLAVGLGVLVVLRRATAPRITPDVHPDVLDVLAHGETAVDVERYRVFLPLREFTDIPLVEFGAAMAKAHDGELSLLHVVEIPRNLPAKAIRFRYVDDRIHGLQRLSRVGMHEGVDTRAVVKIGSKVYEIILDTMHDEAVNLLVMGWRGERIEGDRRIMGSNIDYLVENAPCDLVVFKTRGMRRQLRRIVVLSSRLWSLGGVDEIATILAERDRAVIAVVGIAEGPEGAEALKAAAGPLVERCRSYGVEIEQKVVYSKAFEATALAEGADADLLIVRASPRTAPRSYSLGPVEDRIAKLARCPVLIYRPAPAD